MISGMGHNRYSSLPAVRALVQGAFVVFFLLVGVEFHAFYAQLVSGGAVTAQRPAVLEAFLPISALMSLKVLLLTADYDAVHPAGLTVLIAAVLSAVVARKVLCSWVCPIGGISRALAWAGERTLWRRRKGDLLVPVWLDRVLTSLKYLLLAFFLYAVAWRMGVAAIRAFQRGAYNYAADAKMLLFFTEMSLTTAVTLAVLLLLSVAVKNFWCRYLCPYGALLGLVSWLSALRVVRDPAACTDCRACTRACPVEIRVHEKPSVRTPECTGCMTCVCSCPVEDCLTVTRRGRAGWSPWWIPALGLGTIFLLWGIARATGHWSGDAPLPLLADAYRHARELIHP
jgi:polyferredoxin